MPHIASQTRRLILAGLAITALTLGPPYATHAENGGDDSTEFDDDGNDSSDGDSGNGGGDGGADTGAGSAPRRDTYCDELNADEAEKAEPENGDDATDDAADPAGPVVYTPQRKPLELYRYSDGREDSQHVETTIVIDKPATEANADVVRDPVASHRTVTELIDDAGTPVAQRYEVWCEHERERRLIDRYWFDLMTPTAVTEHADLFVKVQRRIRAPLLQFIDADLDHGWLWPRVEHHIRVDAPQPVRASATRSNDWGDTATAWIQAEPVAIEIVIEDQAGAEFTRTCDMAQVTSAAGCPIRFTHATSITDDGYFYGEVRVSWNITSNSGKYDGLGPFITASSFKTQIGEAMAVTCPPTGCNN